MKNIIGTFLLGLLFAFPAMAQFSIGKNGINVNGSNSTQQLQRQALNNTLTKFDQDLVKRFGLDGAKTELVGDVLKIKVADKDFAKMNSVQQNNLANNINNLSGNMLKQLGDQLLRGLGLNKVANVVVELASGLGANGTRLMEKVFPRK